MTWQEDLFEGFNLSVLLGLQADAVRVGGGSPVIDPPRLADDVAGGYHWGSWRQRQTDRVTVTFAGSPECTNAHGWVMTWQAADRVQGGGSLVISGAHL